MKFTCDKCHTKYSIADERVKGRVLKIRCKSCNNVITVREEQHPSIFGSMSSGHTSPVSLSDLEDVFDKKDGGGDEHTVVSSGPLPGMMNDPVPESDEWYVSFDGEQEGPFPLQRAVERVRQEMPRGKEIHCWRPGFFVWLPLEEVPDFQRALKPVARPPAIPPAARSVPARPTGSQKAISGTGSQRALGGASSASAAASAAAKKVTRDPTGPRAALAVANAVPGSNKDLGGDSKPMPLPPPPDVPSPLSATHTRPETASAYRKAGGAQGAVAKAGIDGAAAKKPAFPTVERKPLGDLPKPSNASSKMPALRSKKEEPHAKGENGFAAALTANAGGTAAPTEEAKPPDTGPVPLPPPPGDDLPIGEASGLLNLSHLKPGISGVRPRGAVVETFGGVPVTSTPASTPNGAAATASSASPVVVVAGPAPSSVPPWMKYAAIAGIAMTALLACVVVYLVTRPPVVKTVEVEGPSRKLIDNPIAMVDPGNPGQPAQPGQDPRKGQPVRHVAGAKQGPAPGAKQAPADPQKGLSSAQRNLANLYGEAETAQPHEIPGMSGSGRKQASVSESALAGVVQQNKSAMGLCYQRVLKHDPTLKSAKMVAKVKIGISGRVTNVSFGDPTLGQAEIGQCLAQSIKRWNFPASDSEYDFEFPIVLTAN
jgi:predicted Zn finger-like uncharacterized protein